MTLLEAIKLALGKDLSIYADLTGDGLLFDTPAYWEDGADRVFIADGLYLEEVLGEDPDDDDIWEEIDEIQELIELNP